MNTAGFVYILINQSMKDLIKIGKTTKDPEERLKELSSSTGVPTPFTLVYKEYFDDCDSAERLIHSTLGEKGYRLSNNREFFNAPIYVAIELLQQLKQQCIGGTYYTSTESSIAVPANPIAFLYYEKALEAYRGYGDVLKDYKIAYELFEKAADYGSSHALRMLGLMTKDGEGTVKSIEGALVLLMQGAKLRNRWCYPEMAVIYQSISEYENAEKCWNKYYDMLEKGTSSIHDYDSFRIYIEHFLGNNNEKIFPYMTIHKNELINFYERLNTVVLQQLEEESSEDPVFVEMHNNRIRFLNNLPAYIDTPTVYNAFNVSQTDDGDVFIFTTLLSGQPISFEKGNKILISNPTQSLVVTIDRVIGDSASPGFIQLNKDIDDFLFIKEKCSLILI